MRLEISRSSADTRCLDAGHPEARYCGGGTQVHTAPQAQVPGWTSGRPTCGNQASAVLPQQCRVLHLHVRSYMPCAMAAGVCAPPPEPKLLSPDRPLPHCIVTDRRTMQDCRLLWQVLEQPRVIDAQSCSIGAVRMISIYSRKMLQRQLLGPHPPAETGGGQPKLCPTSAG